MVLGRNSVARLTDRGGRCRSRTLSRVDDRDVEAPSWVLDLRGRVDELLDGYRDALRNCLDGLRSVSGNGWSQARSLGATLSAVGRMCRSGRRRIVSTQVLVAMR